VILAAVAVLVCQNIIDNPFVLVGLLDVVLLGLGKFKLLRISTYYHVKMHSKRELCIFEYHYFASSAFRPHIMR
jgi:hypothetical protein